MSAPNVRVRLRRAAARLVICVALGPLGAGRAPANPSPMSIALGPEILVSRNEPYAHVETTIAASGVNQLVGSSITLRGESGVLTEIYTSNDGGNTWDLHPLDKVFRSSGDPKVTYLGQRPFQVSIGKRLGHQGAELALLSQSALGSWTYLSGARTLDRPMLFSASFGNDSAMYLTGMKSDVLDTPACKGKGNVTSLLYSCIYYYLAAFKSIDKGRQFGGPYTVFRDKPGYGLNSVESPQLLSDRRMVYPFVEWSNVHPNLKQAPYYLAVSKPNTLDFASKRLIAVQTFQPRSVHTRSIAFTLVLAADQSRGPLRDTLYAAWADAVGPGLRIKLSRSRDEGKTWSEPTIVSPSTCNSCLQYIPTIAIAPNGTVALMWLDTRDTQDDYSYDVYFAASLDGGATFLPARRVTTVSSRATDEGNLEPKPYCDIMHEEGKILTSITTAYARFPAGGDYLALTADSESRFHLLWPDSRSGPYQAYTTAAWVANISPTPPPADASTVDITSDVSIEYDPGQFDSLTKTYEVPIRIVNTSNHTLLPPFTMSTTSDFDRLLPGVSILNADNTKTGSGASLSYTEALRDNLTLPPHGVSSARIWRLRTLSIEDVIYNIPLRVYGRLQN